MTHNSCEKWTIWWPRGGWMTVNFEKVWLMQVVMFWKWCLFLVMQEGSADPEAGPVTAPLLCCICQDHNTTFRYEVVYKQANKSITILDLTDVNKEELECLTHEDSSNSAASEFKVNSIDSEAEYYNYPPKHPRHGHLKWPVWKPSVTSDTSSYPDYPIHIPTFTLQRINNLLANKSRRGSVCNNCHNNWSYSCHCESFTAKSWLPRPLVAIMTIVTGSVRLEWTNL